MSEGGGMRYRKKPVVLHVPVGGHLISAELKAALRRELIQRVTASTAAPMGVLAR